MPERKFYTGKIDRVFKTIFCNSDDSSMLEEFLSRILKKEVEIIQFLNKELPVVNTIDKVKTVDVLILVDGEYIHLEVNSNYQPYLHPRNFIYFTNFYSRKVSRNEEYDFKEKFLHIDLTYGLGKTKEEIYHYYVMDDKNNKYLKNFEIIEYNMDRIMEYWYNLDKEKLTEYKHLIMLDLGKEELSEVSRGDDFVGEFKDKLVDLNSQERFQSFMSYEEDQRMIHNTEKRMAFEEGINQGVEQGIQEEKINNAKAMLEKKIDVKTISDITGLSIDEIKNL